MAHAASDPRPRTPQVLGVGASLLSLVDVERQWFKVAVGLDEVETSRDAAFCDHTIQPEPTGLPHVMVRRVGGGVL